MKLKIVILACLLVWCCIWGVPYFKQSAAILSSYADSKASILELKKQRATAKKNVDNLYKQVNQMRDGKPDLSDKVEVAQAIETLDGVTLNSITAEKVNSLGESVIIATVTNFADVSNFTDIVTCMKFDISTNNIEKTLTDIEELKLVTRSLQVLPVEGQIILDVQIGGVSE